MDGVDRRSIAFAREQLGGGEIHHRGAGFEDPALEEDGMDFERSALDVDGHAAAYRQEAAGVDDHARTAPPAAGEMGVPDEDEPGPWPEDTGERLGPGRRDGPRAHYLERTPRRPALAHDGANGGEIVAPVAGAVKLDGEGGAFAGVEALLEVEESVLVEPG